MHVLIFTNHFAPESFRINDLAFGLVERGHQVSVVTGLPNYPEGKVYPGYGFFKRNREVINGVKVRRIPLIPRGRGRSINLVLNYLSSAFYFCTLTPFLCRDRYDAIFVFETSPVTIGLPAIVMKWKQRIPIVFWVLDLWPDSLSATGAVTNKYILSMVRTVVRRIYKRCDRILASSRGFEESIHAVGGYDGKVDYFPNWVEPELAGACDTVKDLPTLPDGFRIVFTGNIGVAQDFDTILNAATMLSDRKDIQWIIVGDGRQVDHVREEISKRGLQDCFHLMGRFPLEAMPYFCDAADALLLPLRDEPIFALTAPGKLCSYLAAGKPVIASINGEGANLIRDAQAGVSCPAENPVGLRDAVLELYHASEQERQAMGARGLEYAKRHFDRETLFDQLEETLAEVTAKPELVPQS